VNRARRSPEPMATSAEIRQQRVAARRQEAEHQNDDPLTFSD